MADIAIRPARPSDVIELARLREALWPEASAEEHGRELTQILAGRAPEILPLVIIVAEEACGILTGFVEAGLRSYADGCDPSHPVGYVEGWHVAQSHRRRGIGARLLDAAEDWARSQGCVEMASDARIDNELPQRVHEALGFDAVERSVHYRKAL